MPTETLAEKSQEEKEKILSCFQRGPGPSYKLPPTVGYIDHDPSRIRAPAFSILGRVNYNLKCNSPGPAYAIPWGLTARGPNCQPHYSITGRTKQGGDCNDRPFYCPDINAVRSRPPAFSIIGRNYYAYTNTSSPGPIYNVPSALGPKVPDKRAAAEVTLKGRPELKGTGSDVPFYNIDGYDRKKCNPGVTIKGRHDECLKSQSPGPGSYNISGLICKVRPCPPKFSLGIRHSPCTSPYVTKMDCGDEPANMCCNSVC